MNLKNAIYKFHHNTCAYKIVAGRMKKAYRELGKKFDDKEFTLIIEDLCKAIDEKDKKTHDEKAKLVKMYLMQKGFYSHKTVAENLKKNPVLKKFMKEKEVE